MKYPAEKVRKTCNYLIYRLLSTAPEHFANGRRYRTCHRSKGEAPNQMDKPRTRILIAGPFSSAVTGGVASMARAHLQNSMLNTRFVLDQLDTSHPGPGRPGFAIRLIKSCVLALRLIAKIALERAALVHLHSSSGGSFYQKALLQAICRLLGRKTVLHIHGGNFIDFYRSSRVKPIIRLLLRQSSRVVVVADWLREFLLTSCGIYAEAVPNWPAEQFFTAQADPGANQSILFVGELTENKGLPVLLEAIALVRAEGAGNPVVLAAGRCSPLSAKTTKRELENRGLDGVEIMQDADSGQIRLALEQAAVFVLPSLVEALPVALLEAMAVGVPSVVSRVGGTGEAITDGAQGYLTTPGDSATLAARLTTLLGDPELRRSMGARAREKAIKEFHPDCCGKKLADIYRSLLEH
jgi:glycosyltransferase involved in cell wall biosynthesis